MLLSRAKKMIFVKGLKVAGTSLEVHLAPQLEPEAIVTRIFPVPTFGHVPRNYEVNGEVRYFNHMTALQIIDQIGETEFGSFFSWGIVRHPVEKILSYFYMQFQRVGSHYTIDDAIKNCPTDFERFCDSNGKLLLTRVLKYEDLSIELPPLLSSLGLTADGFSSVRQKAEFRTIYAGPPVEISPEQHAAIEQRFRFALSFY